MLSRRLHRPHRRRLLAQLRRRRRAGRRPARPATSRSPPARPAPARRPAPTRTPAPRRACSAPAPARRSACSFRSRAFRAGRRLLPVGRRLQRRSRLRSRSAATASSRAPPRRCDDARRHGVLPDRLPRRATPAPRSSSEGDAATCSATLRRRGRSPPASTGDGCCPAWCTSADDTDCPRDLRQRRDRARASACDRGITAGLPGRLRRTPATTPTPARVDLVRRHGRGLLARLPAPRRVTACLARRRLLPRRLHARRPTPTAPTRAATARSAPGETCDPPLDLPDQLPRRRRSLHARAAHGRPRTPATSPAGTSRSRPARAAPPICCCPTGCTRLTGRRLASAWGPREAGASSASHEPPGRSSIRTDVWARGSRPEAQPLCAPQPDRQANRRRYPRGRE